MIVKIDNYDQQYRIASFAKSENIKECLEKKSLNVAMVKNGCIVFYPENISFQLSEHSLRFFNASNNFDVFEISKYGNAYRCYDSSSLDNALLVTNRCNSNCIMCPTAESIRRGHEEYNGNQLVALAKYIPDDAAHITITGGEPFLIKKDIFILLDYLKRNLSDVPYLLLTNGRAFCSNEYTNLFRETTPSNIQLGIPLHGYSPETHDMIVQSNGAFDQTFMGLKNLLSINAKIELRIVVSKLNADFISKIAELIVEEFRNVFCVKIIGLEMTGNAAVNRDKVWIDYPEAFIKSEDGIEFMIKSGIDVGIYNFPLCAVRKKYWNICEKSISPYKVRYAKQCDECKVKDACGGVFSGTIRLAKDGILPVR